MKKRLSIPVTERFHATLKTVAAHEKLPITLYVQNAVSLALANSLNILPIETPRRVKAHDA